MKSEAEQNKGKGPKGKFRLGNTATMRGHLLLVIGVLLSLTAGCVQTLEGGKESVAHPSASITLTEAKRTELGLPLIDALTLATAGDIANANGVSDDVRAVINSYIEREHRGAKWAVSALREVDGYLLLWLNFQEIADGGVDIIYSKNEKAVVGTFVGGYRG